MWSSYLHVMASNTENRRNASLLTHVENVVEDVREVLKNTDPKEREIQLKSVLFYWLGIVFDDGAAESAELKIALDTTKQMVARLKDLNEKLRQQLRKSLRNMNEV